MKVVNFAKSTAIGEPQCPRKRKRPNDGDDHHFHETPKLYYRQLYYEILDNATNSIEKRFDQKGYKVYCNLEQLLIKASTKADFEDEFKIVCEFYKDDFNQDDLKAQLVTFGIEFQVSAVNTKEITIFDIRDHFKAYSKAQKDLLGEVVKVLQLIMVMPATNATSERSFSALRRVKNYLRATMTQERLNNLLILHVHKERTDSLDLKEVANDFISNSEHRTGIFGHF